MVLKWHAFSLAVVLIRADISLGNRNGDADGFARRGRRRGEWHAVRAGRVAAAVRMAHLWWSGKVIEDLGRDAPVDIELRGMPELRSTMA
ncbi:hypothetical protein [Microbispora sp. H10949]|uniref:hypothetical protein n=1 Tax=Microbispora sp. H10949 TaxID=2729111 RepID=UPI0015FF5C7D|nr:hypothetical protein [Microbispora sp. H10949]